MKQLLILAFWSLVMTLSGQSLYNETAPIFFADQEGVFMSGYDLVSYYEGTPEKGNRAYSTDYEGVSFWFSNQERLNIFKENQDKYLPQYGGWCAIGICFNTVDPNYPNGKYKTDPLNYELHKGKLYFFYPENEFPAKATWSQNKTTYINSADGIWRDHLLKFSKSPHWYFNVTAEGVALDGYDVVAYHTEDKAIVGKKELAFNYQGVWYHFTSAENKALFKKDPQKYLPAFGGWCTYLMGIDPAAYPPTRGRPDPENFTLIEGRLHVFGKTGQQNFKEVFKKGDQQAILKRANSFWKTRKALADKSDGLPEGMHPHARMELLEWMPFMGDWECELKWWADTTGKNILNYQGNWYFRFGYFGYCIQDDYVGKQKSLVAGTPNGPAIRAYDPANQEWHMTYIPVNQPRDNTWMMRGNFISDGIIEGTMELKDPSGKPVLQRIRLESRSEDEFIWSADWSYDQGKTWLKNIGYSVNKRLK